MASIPNRILSSLASIVGLITGGDNLDEDNLDDADLDAFFTGLEVVEVLDDLDVGGDMLLELFLLLPKRVIILPKKERGWAGL